jgi:exodeoxyribonuclease VIII
MSVAHPPIGIHRLTDNQYFGIDLPSSSSTKTLLNGTNAHLAHERETPREETDAFAVGAYTHALLLDPKSIETNFIRVGDIDRRTKDGKEAWASAQRRANLTGARIVTDDQVALATAMANSVYENPSAASLINTAIEREITIIGAIGNRPAKCKADAVIRLAQACIVLDIKTTESASPRDFAASAAKFGYYHQAAFYRRLIEQTHLGVVDDFVIIAVEKKPPHLCAVYRIPTSAIEIADARIDALVERWWKVQEGDRTGYDTHITELDPPRWWVAND